MLSLDGALFIATELSEVLLLLVSVEAVDPLVEAFADVPLLVLAVLPLELYEGVLLEGVLLDA